MRLRDNIRRILLEETDGLKQFLQMIIERYPQTEYFIEIIESSIQKSECKKIEVAKFKHPALGLALHNGVLFNESIFNLSLPNFLFVVFHEIAHQYQYKKYGNEKMYEFYLGELGIKEAAITMKQIEITADEFATRKLRELVRIGYISKDKISGFGNFYKNAPLQQFEKLITQARDTLQNEGKRNFEDVADYFYNMVKLNT